MLHRQLVPKQWIRNKDDKQNYFSLSLSCLQTIVTTSLRGNEEPIELTKIRYYSLKIYYPFRVLSANIRVKI